MHIHREHDVNIHKASVSFDSYEQMAGYYSDEVDTKPFNAYYERPATLSLLPNVRGRKVLDAGCAAGWYSQWLIGHGADVVAVDFSPNMIAMAKKRLGGKAAVIRADLNEPLSFLAGKSFDIVLSSLTLHYIRDWQPVMNEFARILKPAGHLIFSVHHPFMEFTYFNCENYFVTELLDDEWETNRGKVKVQFYRRPLAQIIAPVISAGFRIETLLEPTPTEKFRELHPQVFEKLTRRPHFLVLRAGLSE
ncbi:class I SAM-dependent methyltransferase [Sporomusa aerivorans]|uniref:class I SAM-dependent methyltransferase n=1 Tax=Sporomusa aerivorans TaxID=204936 RepID=UPI003529D9F5